MKKLFFMITVVALFSITACGEGTTTVPSSVKSAFAQKFPKATKVKWDMENEKEWEAEFKMDGKEYSANFEVSGLWKETEYEIKKSEIPSLVKATLDKEFAGYKIEEAEVSETTQGKVFEFKLEKDETEMEIAIDPNGIVLKKEVKSEEEEDEE